MSIIDFILSLFGIKKQAEKTTEQQTATQQETPVQAEPAEQTEPEGPAEPAVMAMHEDVFQAMTARETDEGRAYLRQKMAEYDRLKTPEYVLTTRIGIYRIKRSIDRYGGDLTDQYGTQYEVTY